MPNPPLNLQNVMSHFRQRWSTASDVRKPSNHTQYTVADGILAAFSVFFMQSNSFRGEEIKAALPNIKGVSTHPKQKFSEKRGAGVWHIYVANAGAGGGSSGKKFAG